MAKLFNCSKCGPAGYEVELSKVSDKLVKVCNCCGTEKKFNKRKTSIAQTQSKELMNWLLNEA